MQMTKREFLLEMDNILDLPASTLQGHEQLEELKNWDSTALVALIVLAEGNRAVRISPAQIVNCTTVADILKLAGVDGCSA